jgi:hypothetical protein
MSISPFFRGRDRKVLKTPAPACYSVLSIEAGAQHVYTPGGQSLPLLGSCLRVVTFVELRQCEVRRIR